MLIRPPDGWPRTSRDGATVATFGPLPVDSDCNVNVEARPVAMAARTLKGFVAQETCGVLSGRPVGRPLVWAIC